MRLLTRVLCILLICLLQHQARAGMLVRKNYFVAQSQWPTAVPRTASFLFLHYYGNYGSLPIDARSTDTIWNLKTFLDSVQGTRSNSVSYSVAFAHGGTLDSAWRLDGGLKLIERCHTLNGGG